MSLTFRKKQDKLLFRIGAFVTILSFLLNSIILPSRAYAQSTLNLPAPGSMITMSVSFAPPIIKGLRLYPDNPLRFDFIVDTGDKNIQGKEFEAETTKLIKYFLASLTVPEDEFWVNLSPYEKDRIIPEGLGVTELGRDLLAQDYLLKQITASLMYPEEELGSEFWQRVYDKAQRQYGTTKIPINTFNKVWIVPDRAVVYENDGGAYVGGRHLKVLLEEDYLALKNNIESKEIGADQLSKKEVETLSNVASEVVREVVIPELEKEVNEGTHFANLRQIFNSMILATWYKKNLRETLLGQVYMDQNKVKGVDVEDKNIKEKIYNQYVEAYKKGVYNYIKEDYDVATRKIIARKYFSGGVAPGVVRVQSLEVRQFDKESPDVVVEIVGPESAKGSLRMVTIDLLENIDNDQIKLAKTMSVRQNMAHDDGFGERSDSTRERLDESIDYEAPSRRTIGAGYTLDIPVPESESKYHLRPERRDKFVDYLHETTGIIDTESIEMQTTHKEVRNIIDILLRSAGLNPEHFIFHFVDSPDANAFVLKHSNHIFVNMGLINYIIRKGGTRDSLAFVLAHEITHINQFRDDIDSGEEDGLPKNWEDSLETYVAGYADEYDADWRALRLLEKVYVDSNGEVGFALTEATFVFQNLVEDLEKELKEASRSRRFVFDIKSKFGTHPQLKERIRKLQKLINSLYWKSYFVKPTKFSSELVEEAQRGSQRNRFRRDVEQIQTLDDYKGLLNRTANLAEIEYLFITTYELAKNRRLSFNLNEAFELLDKKFDELIEETPELRPYYLFIILSMGRFVGMDFDYDRQKQAVKDSLNGLSFEQMHDLLKITLPPILDTSDDSEYFEYKYTFYGLTGSARDSRSEMRWENYSEIWVDALMERIDERESELSTEQVLELRDSLEANRQRIKQMRPRLTSVWRQYSPGNRELFHVYNFDIAWYLWERIQADPVGNSGYISDFIDKLRVLQLSQEANYRQGALTAPGSARAERYQKMLDGLRQLMDQGHVEKSKYIDFAINKGGRYDKELSSKHRNQEINNYPNGDLIDFTGTDIDRDLEVFMTMFASAEEYFSEDMRKMIDRLASHYGLSITQKLNFVERSYKKINEAWFSTGTEEERKKKQESFYFIGGFHEYLRNMIFSLPQTPEVEAYLTAKMEEIERDKELTGLSALSFEMKRLLYLYHVGSGIHPWTLKLVLFGRDADNGHMLSTYAIDMTDVSQAESEDELKAKEFGLANLDNVDDLVRQGASYRSDVMFRVTQEQIEKLGQSGIRMVDDLIEKAQEKIRETQSEVRDSLVLLTMDQIDRLPEGTVLQSITGVYVTVGKDNLNREELSGGVSRYGIDLSGALATERQRQARRYGLANASKLDELLANGARFWDDEKTSLQLTPEQLAQIPEGTILKTIRSEKDTDNYVVVGTMDEEKGRGYGLAGGKRIDAHPLFGVQFSNEDLVGLYRFLSKLPSEEGSGKFARMEDYDARNIYTTLGDVDTWDEYIAVLGIQGYLRSRGVNTTNVGMQPRVFDAGEYDQVPSYFKAFVGELFELPGLEVIGNFAFRDPGRMAQRYRAYHGADPRPMVLLRHQFNDGPVDQMFEQAFGFVNDLEGSLDEKVDQLVDGLPPSVFRNFALFTLFLNDVLRTKLRSKGLEDAFDMHRAFEPSYTENFIRSNFSMEEQVELLGHAETMMKHIIWDKRIDAANRKEVVEAVKNVLGSEKVITHDEELARRKNREREVESSTRASRDNPEYVYIPETFDSTGFTPYEYHVAGGIEAHVEFVVPHMFTSTLEAIFKDPNVPVEQKIAHFKAMYPRASNVRDQHLDNIITNNSLTPDEVKELVPLFASEYLAEKYSLHALEKERELYPERFEDLDYELERILHYFPDFGYIRDDILNDLINRKVTHPKQLQQVQSLLLLYQDNVRREESRKAISGKDMSKTIFEDYSFDENQKKDFLLWVLGFTDKKPDFLVLQEYNYHVNFDTMRANTGIHDSPYYRNVGKSAFEDSLEYFLFGEKGILSNESTKRDFLNEIFDSIIPEGTEDSRVELFRDIFLSAFDHSSDIRQNEILKNLFIAVKRIASDDQLTAEEKEARAVRAFLESSGFVFIKLGQFLESSGMDLPQHIAKELAHLKGNVEMLPKSIALAVIDNVYGDFYGYFETLDEPLGGASIKSVFRARLKEGTPLAEKAGRLDVVVKVKRPDVEKRTQEEFELLEKVLTSIDGLLRRQGISLPSNMVQRVHEMVEEELDFDNEQANQKALKENVPEREKVQLKGGNRVLGRFIKSSGYEIEVPVASEVRSNMVMVEDLVEGAPLSATGQLDEMGFDGDKVSEMKAAVAEEFLKEVFIDGFYHGDLHSDNVRISPDGKVNFIDVGFMGRLSARGQEAMQKLLLFVNKDQIKAIPMLSRLLGVPNAREVASILEQIPDEDVVITENQVNEIANSSGNALQKMLMYLNLIEEEGASLPREYVSLNKAFGTAGYLYDHLTIRNLARVLLEVRANRGRQRPEPPAIVRNNTGKTNLQPESFVDQMGKRDSGQDIVPTDGGGISSSGVSSLVDREIQSSAFDNTEVSSDKTQPEYGGIDFNPAMLDLQIKRDGNGIPLPVFQQPIHNMKIDGFLPVIINVSPVSIPFLLGDIENEKNLVNTGFNLSHLNQNN